MGSYFRVLAAQRLGTGEFRVAPWWMEVGFLDTGLNIVVLRAMDSARALSG